MGGERLVVVLGMHRSGTSAITRSLRVLGVELGDSLLPAQKDNPKGFFEDSDLNSLHIEMLDAIGQKWDSIRSVLSCDVDRLEQLGFLEKAAGLLQQKLSLHSQFAFKDPRTAKLLGFWQKVFKVLGLDLSYLIVVRNPLSVAHSLATRDGLGIEKSYALWLRHLVDSLSYTAGKTRTLVEFDILMSNPEGELRRLARDLAFGFDYREFEVFTGGFLQENLRHTRFEPEDLLNDPTCSPFIYEVYSYLRKLCQAGGDFAQTLSEKASAWQRAMASIETIFRLVDISESRADALNMEISLLTGTLAEKKAAVEELTQSLEMQSERISELESYVCEGEFRLAQLGTSLASLEFRLEEIYNCTSWRVTAPFRALSRTLSKRSGE